MSEQNEIDRWLAGVRRYARKKGFDLKWNPMTQATVHGDSAMKASTVKEGLPAAAVTGTKDEAMAKAAEASFVDELEKIATPTPERMMRATLARLYRGARSSSEGIKAMGESAADIKFTLEAAKGNVLPEHVGFMRETARKAHSIIPKRKMATEEQLQALGFYD